MLGIIKLLNYVYKDGIFLVGNEEYFFVKNEIKIFIFNFK